MRRGRKHPSAVAYSNVDLTKRLFYRENTPTCLTPTISSENSCQRDNFSTRLHKPKVVDLASMQVISFLLLSISLMASSSSEQAEAFAASADANDIPRLPPPEPDSDLPTIRLGETISFEKMGPIILNTDGTTRRIENWDTLTKQEQEVTWRRISQRNEVRRQMLLKQQEELMKQQNEKGEDEAMEL